MHPAQLQECADTATGYNAGTGRSRPQQHTARAVMAQDLMCDRGAVLGNHEQVLASVIDRLLDRQRNFLGLAVADADRALAVAHRHKSGEREAPAALDDLRHSVDMYHALLKVERICLDLCQSPTPLPQKSKPPWRAPSARAFTLPW